MKILRQFSVSFMWLAAACLSLSAMAQTPPPGIITYIHNDLLGSPAAATNASGVVIWREAYSGYGERLKNEAGATANKVWYTSRHQDEDTALIYMGARYYDPALGRFLSIDPVHFVETNVHSFNRYAYANNNPYKYIDPDGREVRVVGSDDFKSLVSANIAAIKFGNNGRELMRSADGTTKVITIVEKRNGGNSIETPSNADTRPSDSTINFNPLRDTGGRDSRGSSDRPAFVGLAHELGHAVAAAQGAQSMDMGNARPGTTPPSERQSMRAENGVRRDHGLPERPTYY